jgi:histidine triad (HIT) family protein
MGTEECIFCKIVAGEIPCYKIYEDKFVLSFLDIGPLSPGHTLVIPKKEVDYIFDVDDAMLQGLILFAKKIAPAIERSVECKRIGIMVAGLEVPHCHVHLVPINGVGDLNFANAKDTSPEDLVQMAKDIVSNLS